jgi:hypothetical protein
VLCSDCCDDKIKVLVKQQQLNERSSLIKSGGGTGPEKPGNRGEQRCQFQQVITWQMRFIRLPLCPKRYFFAQ